MCGSPALTALEEPSELQIAELASFELGGKFAGRSVKHLVDLPRRIFDDSVQNNEFTVFTKMIFGWLFTEELDLEWQGCLIDRQIVPSAVTLKSKQKKITIYINEVEHLPSSSPANDSHTGQNCNSSN
jgi:hypothetical protein